MIELIAIFLAGLAFGIYTDSPAICIGVMATLYILMPHHPSRYHHTDEGVQNQLSSIAAELRQIRKQNEK